MKLYHGSNVVVAAPDVDHSREKIDFGLGFYVTPVYSVYGTEVKGEPSTATLTNAPRGAAVIVR